MKGNATMQKSITKEDSSSSKTYEVLESLVRAKMQEYLQDILADLTSHEQALQFSPDGKYAGPVTCAACHSHFVNACWELIKRPGAMKSGSVSQAPAKVASLSLMITHPCFFRQGLALFRISIIVIVMEFLFPLRLQKILRLWH